MQFAIAGGLSVIFASSAVGVLGPPSIIRSAIWRSLSRFLARRSIERSLAPQDSELEI